MSLLSASQVNKLRAVTEELMPDTVVVKRHNGTAYATVLTTRCRIVPVRHDRQEVVPGIQSTAQAWHVYAPALTDLRRNDRLAVASDDYGDIELDARDVWPRSFEPHRRILAVEVEA